MKLLIFRALWGMTGPLQAQIAQIADAGYDGVEAWIQDGAPAPSELLPAVRLHGLRLICSTAVEQQADLDSRLSFLASFGPEKINVHSGRDSMSHDDGCRFFEQALRVERAIGIPVVHETHRGRLLFTPWDTGFYLRQFDDLKITADYSHWVNVCERLPDDQGDALDTANRRAFHIHGRVGYEQGPQVPDPSAPEYALHLAWHESQWQDIINFHQSAKRSEMTFTPEYGPPRYLHTLPHTDAPVADLWQLCLWAAERARQRLV